MSRPVTRSQRSLESVRANRGSLGQGQIGNSEVHEREVEQVLEKESDSHEVVRSQVSPELGVADLIGDLGRAAMANQGPPRGGLSGQSGNLGGLPQGAPGGGVVDQGGQQQGPGNPAPFMVMEDLPIVVPINLPIMPMYPHFQTFEGLTHQDPQKHVRDFANTCVSNQVSDDRYLLIWFPTTLRGKAVDWYWSNPARTFTTWVDLRDAFLLKYRAVIDQRGALLALSQLRQEDTETVSEYVARFQLVRQRCANNLLEDATILGFFLEGLTGKVLREVVVTDPHTVDEAVAQALAAERVDQMVNKIKLRTISVPGYLPVNREPRGPLPAEPTRFEYVGPIQAPIWAAPTPEIHAPAPLAVHAPPTQAEFRNEILSAIDRRFETFSEQMSCLVGDRRKPAPPSTEQGPRGTGLWCRGCRQPDHTEQNCPRRPPPRPRRPCPNCGRNHPGECWAHMRCRHCGGQHPDDRCRMRDKIIERGYPQPPPGQIDANLQGQRFPFDPNPAQLPPQHGLYYQQPTGIAPRPPPPQNTSGQYQPPLLPPPSRPDDHHPAPIQPSQDYRRDANVAGTSTNPPHGVHLVEVYPKLKPTLPLPLPTLETFHDALAVQTRNQRQAQRAASGYESSPHPESSDSPGSPHLSELNGVAETMKKELAAARKQATLLAKNKTKEVLANPAPVTLEPPIDLEDPEYEHVRVDAARVGPRRPTVLTFSKKESPPYQLWEDLNTTKANISLAQLLDIAPVVKRTLRSGMSRRRQAKPAMLVQKLRHKIDPGPIKVEVQIADHYVPHCLVDGGSGVNIMSKFTLQKLGLKSSGPSHVSMGLANQTRITPVGQLLGLQVMIGGEVYTLDFQILDIPDDGRSYPLLLGRPWLHQAGAIIDWGRGTITFGRSSARSRVSQPKIEKRRAEHEPPPDHDEEGEWSSSESSDDGGKYFFEDEAYALSPLVPKPSTPPLEITMHKKGQNLGPIIEMGPGLYGWGDDKDFVDWLREHPNSDQDSVMMVEVVDSVEEDESLAIEVDGTQDMTIDDLPREEDVKPPPLRFTRDSSGMKASYDSTSYPGVPDDWYRGPNDTTFHVPEQDWKYVDIDIPNEQPRQIKVGVQLTEPEIAQYKALVVEFRDIFAWSYEDLKGIPPHIAMHSIPLEPGTVPVRQKERRMNPHLQLLVKAELEKLIRAGFIFPIELTTWVSPIVIVKKKNGKLRICVDYRRLNKKTLKDHFPLPFINTLLEEVAGHEMYSFMDGYSGYNQVSIDPADWHKTAFTTSWGTFAYRVMPFGLCNAPSSFQRVMTFAFSDLLRKVMSVFIDDFSVHGTAKDHLRDLRECFLRCRRAGISINPDKTILGVVRGLMLGHYVSKEGRTTDPEKVRVILQLQKAGDVSGVRSILGHTGWYREAMEGYAKLALPLTNLTKKNVTFKWTPECQQAFDALKVKLASAPVLVPPNWDVPFHVYCDASAVAVGSALCQPFEGGRDRPIAFASRQLTAAERNYTTTEREALAMVYSVKKFRHYLLLNPVVFYVDHMALRYLVNKPDLSGRIARWVLLLEEFDYTVEYKPGKKHLQADHLSRLSTTLGTEPIDDEFPDASLFTVDVVPTWYANIATFLSTHKMPVGLSKVERRKVRVNSKHFAIIAHRLYRRGVDGVLRRCIADEEISLVLEASHDSLCGGHFAGRLTAQKALRSGYFWPSMFADAHTHVKRCDACQRFSRRDPGMGMPLVPTLPIVPFERWGIDFIGEVHPSSSRQNRWIIVATDYLTKWAEAKALRIDDAKHTAIFIFENIITRFGCPRVLVSDRGSHFINDLIVELTTIFSIKHRKTTPYHPQTNGQTERTNQTLCHILRKTISDSKRDWDEKLPAALWAYRTSYKVTTRATPFMLVYGTESVLPIEYEVPSLRIAVEHGLPVKDSLRDRLAWLEGLGEFRRAGVQHIEARQRRRKLLFDRKQIPREFKVGTWVLLHDDRKGHFPGKFEALWMGPYVVKEVFTNGSLQLETLQGDVFPNRVNGVRCKIYRV